MGHDTGLRRLGHRGRWGKAKGDVVKRYLVVRGPDCWGVSARWNASWIEGANGIEINLACAGNNVLQVTAAAKRGAAELGLTPDRGHIVITRVLHHLSA